MKCDVINLLRQGAVSLDRQGDGLTAYLLCELANNLRLVLRGEATLDEFKAVYVGADRQPLDIDHVLRRQAPVETQMVAAGGSASN